VGLRLLKDTDIQKLSVALDSALDSAGPENERARKTPG
jgi:hypothetical protein